MGLCRVNRWRVQISDCLPVRLYNQGGEPPGRLNAMRGDIDQQHFVLDQFQPADLFEKTQPLHNHLH